MSLIAAIAGSIAAKGADYALVTVGGVTLKVYAPAFDLASMGDEGAPVRLHTHLIVREDDLQLYGFLEPQAQRLFELLIGVSGVGPRVALGLLSALPAGEAAAAIVSEDIVALARAPGVGKRTAERLILELRQKLEVETRAEPVVPGARATGDAALDFLVSLGFAASEARQALSVERNADLAVEERVRRALQRMGQG